jgi:hypothetical protein
LGRGSYQVQKHATVARQFKKHNSCLHALLPPLGGWKKSHGRPNSERALFLRTRHPTHPAAPQAQGSSRAASLPPGRLLPPLPRAPRLPKRPPRSPASPLPPHLPCCYLVLVKTEVVRSWLASLRGAEAGEEKKERSKGPRTATVSASSPRRPGPGRVRVSASARAPASGFAQATSPKAGSDKGAQTHASRPQVSAPWRARRGACQQHKRPPAAPTRRTGATASRGAHTRLPRPPPEALGRLPLGPPPGGPRTQLSSAPGRGPPGGFQPAPAARSPAGVMAEQGSARSLQGDASPPGLRGGSSVEQQRGIGGGARVHGRMEQGGTGSRDPPRWEEEGAGYLQSERGLTVTSQWRGQPIPIRGTSQAL